MAKAPAGSRTTPHFDKKGTYAFRKKEPKGIYGKRWKTYYLSEYDIRGFGCWKKIVSINRILEEQASSSSLQFKFRLEFRSFTCYVTRHLVQCSHDTGIFEGILDGSTDLVLGMGEQLSRGQTMTNPTQPAVHPAPRSPKDLPRHCGDGDHVIHVIGAKAKRFIPHSRHLGKRSEPNPNGRSQDTDPATSFHKRKLQDYTRLYKNYKKCLFERWKWSGWIWLNSRTMLWTFDFDFVRRSNTDFRHMQEVRSMCKEHQGAHDLRSFRISSRGNRAGSLVVSQCIIPGWGTAAPSAKRPTSATLGLTAVAMTSPLSQNRHSMTQLNHVKSNCDNLSAVKSVFPWQCHHARKDSACGRLMPVYIL